MAQEEEPADLSALWQGIGRVDDSEPDAADLLKNLYGENSRGGVNAQAAADDLGVAPRTIRRWAKEGIPEHAKGTAVRDSHQEWRKSPEGREAGINPRREARLRSKGTVIKFKGRVKVSSSWRFRDIEFDASGEQMSDVLDALLAGNDEAAIDALADAMGEGYFGGDVDVADLDPSALETFR